MELLPMIFASMAMFAIGLIGLLIRRNTLIAVLSIELMLNAANLLFIIFSRRYEDPVGHAWVFFVLVIAAAEAAVGLAIIIALFRSKQRVDMDQYHELQG